MATQLGVFRLRYRPLLIVDRRPSTLTPPRTQAGTRSRSTVQAIRLYIQLFSEYHTEATSLRFLLLTLSSFVVLFTAKLALPRRSSDTQRCHSPIPTGGESISSVPTRSSVQLLPVGIWLAWNGFAPFSPSSSPQSPLVDAASGLVLLLQSCHRAAHHSFFCSPPTAPPSSSLSPLPPFVQYFSFPLVHVLPRILVLTPQRIRRTPSGPAVHFARYPPQGKAYPDPEWSSRSSSLAIRCQEGVSGPRVVQPFLFTRYPPPGRRLRIPGGPAVHLQSLSAARKASPGSRLVQPSISLAVRRQECVSGPRVVQPFIFTRYPLPGGRIRTASGPAVPLHSLPAARKASPDPGRSSRSSSVSIRCQEGVSGISAGPAVHLTRCPPPGMRIRTPSGPAVHLYSPSAARKAYPDRGWFRRSSSLAIRLQEGVSGPRLVQAFIVTRYPPPGRRIGTPSGPGVHLHSLSTARKAYPDPEWSRRSSALAIRLQEGVSGPRVVEPFIFTHCPPPGRRFQTATGPTVHLHSLSAARKAHPDPEWSSRSSSLAIRRQEGAPRPRVVQPFIFTRYPPPGRRIRTVTGPGDYLHSLSAARKPHPDPSGPTVHLHSLSATRKAYPDPEWSRRSSALAIRLQKGVSGPRVVQSFIFTRCPLPGRRIRTLDGPAVHLHSLYTSRKAYPDREWSSRSSSLAIRRQEGVSGPRVVQPFIFTRYRPPGRRTGTPSGPSVHLHPLSAARKAYPDHERSRRLSSLAIRCQEGVSGPREVQPFIFTRYPPPGRRTGTPSGPSVHLRSLSAARRAVPDRDWSRRSSSLVYPLPGRRIRSRGANRSS